MKSVFSLHSDARYRWYRPDMEEETARELFKAIHVRRLAGLSLLKHWPHLPVYLASPDLPSADFSAAPILGRFAISPRIYEDMVMRVMLESAGELLPMKVVETGAVWHIFSPLPKSQCVGVVDEVNCELNTYGDIINYAFHEGKLPHGGIFGLSKHIHAYAVHDSKLPPEQDFIQWYRLQGYTGLSFGEQTGAPAIPVNRRNRAAR